MIEKIEPKLISYIPKIDKLCGQEYYKHRNGCPNLGKKKGCPPNQPQLNRVLNFEKDVYIIYTKFRVGKFAKRMRINHSEWSLRQIYNPMFWQPQARKIQRI